MIIPINIVANRKNTTTKSKLAGNLGENEVTILAFTFSDDWNGTSKTIVYKTPAGELKLPVDLGIDNTIEVDGGLFDAVGTLSYTVYGSFGNDKVINASGELLVGEALANTGGLTITEFTDIIGLCNTATQDAITAKDAAVLATTQVNAAIEGATSTAVGLCEDQVSLANGYAEDASDSATLAANNILNGVSTHNSDIAAHPSILEDIRTVEAIARGRATAYVFDTLAALNAWVAIPENAAQLVVGDNLYIRALNVKDRWWDGTQIQTLESEAPDLTNYYLKTQVDAMMPIIIGQAAYDALVAAGTVDAGRIYYVTGE